MSIIALYSVHHTVGFVELLYNAFWVYSNVDTLLYTSCLIKQLPSRQGWEFTHRFSERIARFLSKNEQFAQKNERFTHSLIFGERPERFAHDRSFPLSNLSKSLI